MKYKTTITTISIHPKNVNPVYGENVTHLCIQDEAAGPFITLSQVGEEKFDCIRIDMEELELITAHARIKGIGVFDVNDRLGSIIEIEQLECLPHYPVVAAIEKLSNLSAGWLEGVGIPPKADDLNWLVNEVTKAFPESLSYPSVAPTEEGNLIFEWIKTNARIELEFNFADKKMELYATDLAASKFEEAAFVFEQWETAFQKVGALLGA